MVLPLARWGLAPSNRPTRKSETWRAVSASCSARRAACSARAQRGDPPALDGHGDGEDREEGDHRGHHLAPPASALERQPGLLGLLAGAPLRLPLAPPRLEAAQPPRRSPASARRRSGEPSTSAAMSSRSSSSATSRSQPGARARCRSPTTSW